VKHDRQIVQLTLSKPFSTLLRVDTSETPETLDKWRAEAKTFSTLLRVDTSETGSSPSSNLPGLALSVPYCGSIPVKPAGQDVTAAQQVLSVPYCGSIPVKHCCAEVSHDGSQRLSVPYCGSIPVKRWRECRSTETRRLSVPYCGSIPVKQNRRRHYRWEPDTFSTLLRVDTSETRRLLLGISVPCLVFQYPTAGRYQ